MTIKKNKMMIHDVSFTLPERSLGRADIEFKVKINGEAFGTLKVSKGNVVWVPKNRTYGHKINWTQFEQIMLEKGKPEKE